MVVAAAAARRRATAERCSPGSALPRCSSEGAGAPLPAGVRAARCDQEAPMGHRLDVGDVIDMLEESVMMRRPLLVKLSDGRVFEDRVQDIIKWEGEDHVVFRQHDLMMSCTLT